MICRIFDLLIMEFGLARKRSPEKSQQCVVEQPPTRNVMNQSLLYATLGISLTLRCCADDMHAYDSSSVSVCIATALKVVLNRLLRCHSRDIKELDNRICAAMFIGKTDWNQLTVLSFHLRVKRRVHSIATTPGIVQSDGQ
jgi:hypothetical protein